MLAYILIMYLIRWCSRLSSLVRGSCDRCMMMHDGGLILTVPFYYSSISKSLLCNPGDEVTQKHENEAKAASRQFDSKCQR